MSTDTDSKPSGAKDVKLLVKSKPARCAPNSVAPFSHESVSHDLELDPEHPTAKAYAKAKAMMLRSLPEARKTRSKANREKQGKASKNILQDDTAVDSDDGGQVDTRWGSPRRKTPKR